MMEPAKAVFVTWRIGYSAYSRTPGEAVTVPDTDTLADPVPSMPPRRILAIDDDPAVRELLVRALGEAGYEVVAVPDAQSGLAAAKEAEFDLLLTNSFMPGLHGTPFMAHLKQAFTDLPILHLDDVRPFRLTALLEAVALSMPDRLLVSETRLSSEVLQGHMPRALSSSHGSG